LSDVPSTVSCAAGVSTSLTKKGITAVELFTTIVWLAMGEMTGGVVAVDDIETVAVVNVKPSARAVPRGVVTDTAPDAPVEETVALICVGEFTTKLAAVTPPNCTWLVPVKFVPVMVMVVPVLPVVGVNPVIVAPPTAVAAKSAFSTLVPDSVIMRLVGENVKPAKLGVMV
jgi:hypothetical protein